ncbi:MAG: hypothetical protein Q7T33_08610 [Dehalococcoidia bacterium]|nr:hypothetical protein [Dehalococcoidia bacterium]
MRQRWFRFGFAPPFAHMGARLGGFWFRSAWRFPRREEYLRMMEEYRQELEDELSGVKVEIERLKKAGEEKD